MIGKPSRISAIAVFTARYRSICRKFGSSEMWNQHRSAMPSARSLSVNEVRNARRNVMYSSLRESVSQPNTCFSTPSTVATIFGACSAPHCVKRWEISKYSTPTRLQSSTQRTKRSKPKRQPSAAFSTSMSCTVGPLTPTNALSGGVNIGVRIVFIPLSAAVCR